MLAILPQVEQSDLYNAWNRSLPSWYPCNKTVSERLVAVYLCPSEPRPDESFGINMAGTRIDMAYASYVGSLGSNYILDYFDYGPGMQPDGVLFRESHVRLGAISDGTSSTFMAGERVHPDPILRPVWAFGATGKVVGDTSSPIQPANDWTVSWGFSSFHQSGAHFLMADGSAGMVSSAISEKVFRELSTRAGHESDIVRPF
jgi:prepilin-type processing-associated H-X9-DG protein